MEPLTTAICLHAQVDDLKFLNPVRNRMGKLLGARLKVYELTNPRSNADALLELKMMESGLVAIFAHGSGDYLRGGEYRSRTTGEIVEVETFLTRTDLGVLSGKVVFCLSCDSNGLAQASVDAGAIAFVGFDAIPFNQFAPDGAPTGSHVLVKHCQELSCHL